MDEIRCCLCAARLETDETLCPICGTDQETTKTSASSFFANRPKKKRWPKRVALIAPITILFITALFVSDVLRTPSQVSHSRKTFRKAMKHYTSSPQQWSAKKKNKTIGDEALLAILMEDLDFPFDENQTVTFLPTEEGENPHLLITKKEKRPFPFRVVLSTEVELVDNEGAIEAKPVAVRRGKRKLTEEAAWAYFGPEMHALDQIDAVR